MSHFVVFGSDKEKSKPKYCFVRLQKPEIRSIDSQMTLVFNTINADQTSPANFKANYTFFTEFGIEGTRVYQNRTCFFLLFIDNIKVLLASFILMPSNKRIAHTIVSKMHATTARINDQPYQFCCHLGIQSLSCPRTPNVITAMPMKNASAKKEF